MEQAVMAWSGGKDAAYALSTLAGNEVEVVELITTINTRYDRSTMHGVRRSLYAAQSASLGIPLNLVDLPPNPSNDEYESIMTTVMQRYRDRGIHRCVYGDLYLEDVRSYREQQLAETGIEGCWPLWGLDTSDLVSEILTHGIKAIVVAVDGDQLAESFAGRELDGRFLDDLPDGVDPCGENGEFHTFVWDGPAFEYPLHVEATKTVTRTVDGTDYHYADLRIKTDSSLAR